MLMMHTACSALSFVHTKLENGKIPPIKAIESIDPKPS
jgi:hypothetical protein